MPKHGPEPGSRSRIMAFLPMRLSASPRPTVVVVLPSRAGVGLIAVTRISLPSFLAGKAVDIVEVDLRLGMAIGNEIFSGSLAPLPISMIGFIFASRAISISLFTVAMVRSSFLK